MSAMTPFRTLVLVAATLASLGSASDLHPTFEMSKNDPARPAREATCKVPVLATSPRRDFVELAIFDVPKQDIALVNDEERRKGWESHEGPKSAADLLWVVGPDACKLGADALLAEVNGLGFYVRAVAIAWVDSASEPATPAPPSSTEPVAPAATP